MDVEVFGLIMSIESGGSEAIVVGYGTDMSPMFGSSDSEMKIVGEGLCEVDCSTPN